jgi:hypothetical protein
LEKLSKKQDPWEQLSTHSDFESFRKPMRKFFDKNTDPLNEAVRLKILRSSEPGEVIMPLVWALLFFLGEFVWLWHTQEE